MRVDEIEIIAGKPDFAFAPVRRLEVKCEASNALMPAPTIEEANGRLRALAAKLGANAIVEVDYNSGVSFTSWKSLKATGLAVIRESADIACEICAETIKRAALKCRHCGVERLTAPVENVKMMGSTEPVAQPAVTQEPLRDNNNPAIIIAAVIGAFVLLTLLASAG